MPTAQHPSSTATPGTPGETKVLQTGSPPQAKADAKDKPTVHVVISARALFHLEDEEAVFNLCGVDQYKAVMKAREDVVLQQGLGMPFIRALLAINQFLGNSAKVSLVTEIADSASIVSQNL